MAHSNRAKLKASRGGMTRNQQRKARNTSNVSGSTRLQETINWLAKLEESKRVKVNAPTVSKVVNYPKDKRTIARRIKALSRLEQQLVLKSKMPKKSFLVLDMIPLEDRDITRIKKEISILKSRL